MNGTLSECCKAKIYGTLGDGVLLGHCEACRKTVCRVNPRTGKSEWLDDESPWTSRDDLRPMPPDPSQATPTARRPPIVALIGSTRFKDQYMGVAQRETLSGNIVLVPGFYHHVDRVPLTDEDKKRLDDLMIAKVELADVVYVINVHGYVGETTKRGIRRALELKKWVRSMEPLGEALLAELKNEP